jgi:PIN domain
MVVIDELDGLKRSSNKKSRWRAGYTLALIDRLLGDDPNRQGTVHQTDRTPDVLESRGEVTIEALLDPPGHQRLPINDDEIIDRALAAQVLAGTGITVITYDTGQSMRARAAGLGVKKLNVELDLEAPG